jgi:hypothetical protein
MAAIPPALDDADIAALQALLDAVPADFEALDLCALDGPGAPASGGTDGDS